MEEVYNRNISLFNRAIANTSEIIKKVYNLSFFDKTNYEANNKELNLSFVDEEDGIHFNNNQFLMYNPQTNMIYVKGSILEKEDLNIDLLNILLLHELLHMASTNRKKNKTGFDHEAFPKTYNEGLTQYLILKLYYDELTEEVMNNNPLYPSSTIEVKKIIDKLGEDKVFNGFFKADARKSVDGFTPKELDVWTDTIMNLSNSLEEKMFKNNTNELSENDEVSLK